MRRPFWVGTLSPAVGHFALTLPPTPITPHIPWPPRVTLHIPSSAGIVLEARPSRRIFASEWLIVRATAADAKESERASPTLPLRPSRRLRAFPLMLWQPRLRQRPAFLRTPLVLLLLFQPLLIFLLHLLSRALEQVLSVPCKRARGLFREPPSGKCAWMKAPSPPRRPQGRLPS